MGDTVREEKLLFGPEWLKKQDIQSNRKVQRYTKEEILSFHKETQVPQYWNGHPTITSLLSLRPLTLSPFVAPPEEAVNI